MQQISMAVLPGETAGAAKAVSPGTGGTTPVADFAALLAMEQAMALALASQAPGPADAPSSSASNATPAPETGKAPEEDTDKSDPAISLVAALLAPNLIGGGNASVGASGVCAVDGVDGLDKVDGVDGLGNAGMLVCSADGGGMIGIEKMLGKETSAKASLSTGTNASAETSLSAGTNASTETSLSAGTNASAETSLSAGTNASMSTGMGASTSAKDASADFTVSALDKPELEGAKDLGPVVAPTGPQAPEGSRAADSSSGTEPSPLAGQLEATLQAGVRAGVISEDQVARFGALEPAEGVGKPEANLPDGISSTMTVPVLDDPTADHGAPPATAESPPAVQKALGDLIAGSPCQSGAAVSSGNANGPATDADPGLASALSQSIATSLNKASSTYRGIDDGFARAILHEVVGNGVVKPRADAGVPKADGETVAVSSPQTGPRQLDARGGAVAAAPPEAAPEALPALMARTVHLMVSEGTKTLSVHLSPPSLGDLHVEVSSSVDGLNVRLLSANGGVRDILQGQVQVLRDALDQSGLHATSVTILPDGASAQMAGQFHSGAGNAPPSFSGEQPGRVAVTSVREHKAVAFRTDGGHQGVLNVFA